MGLAGGLLIRNQLTDFQAQLLRSIAEGKSREGDTAISTLAGRAEDLEAMVRKFNT